MLFDEIYVFDVRTGNKKCNYFNEYIFALSLSHELNADPEAGFLNNFHIKVFCLYMEINEELCFRVCIHQPFQLHKNIAIAFDLIPSLPCTHSAYVFLNICRKWLINLVLLPSAGNKCADENVLNYKKKARQERRRKFSQQQQICIQFNSCLCSCMHRNRVRKACKCIPLFHKIFEEAKIITRKRDHTKHVTHSVLCSHNSCRHCQ